MKTLLKTAVATALLTSAFGAISETYTVEVALNSSIGETPLVATQKVAMSYPELHVSEITKEGAICYLSPSSLYDNSKGFDGAVATSVNSLCPNLSGTRAVIELSGIPNAAITVHSKLPLQVQSGVRFGWLGAEYDVTSSQAHLNENGTLTTSLGSSIDLVDKSQVTDSLLVFNYEITGAYQ